jgi:hypothetical protein
MYSAENSRHLPPNGFGPYNLPTPGDATRLLVASVSELLNAIKRP